MKLCCHVTSRLDLRDRASIVWCRCVCVCVHQAGGQHPRICVGELRGASIHRPGLRQPAWAKAEDEAKSFRLSEMSEEVGHSQSTEAAKQASSTARGCWQGAGLILQM
jgi:hypothetical protein